MIFNYAVMADMIAAPQNHVISDCGEWLDSIVFKDKAVITNRNAGKDGRFRADIADQLISLIFDLFVDRFAKPVHAPWRHRSEEAKVCRRIRFLDALEGHDGQLLEGSLFRQVLFIHAKGDDFMRTVVLKI